MEKRVFFTLILGCIMLTVFVFFHNKLINEYTKNRSYVNMKPYKNVWVERNKKTKTYKDVVFGMLRATCSILTQFDIKPILIFGTLLGHARHNDLVPWDDKVELCVSDEDMHKILGLPEFQKYGLSVKFNPRTRTIRVYNSTMSWPFIDIYGYTTNENQVMIPGFDKMYTFNMRDMLPIKLEKFALQIPLYVPNNTNFVLDKIYGDTWSKECSSASWSAKTDKMLPKQFKTSCENALNKIDSKLFNHVYVINLDRRPDRWEKTKNRLNAIGIEPKRWRAIDGKNDPAYEKYKKNRKLSQSEAACYDSHVSLWKYIYENNIPSALIFEDDILITPGTTLDEILSDVQSNGSFDIFFLGHVYSNLGKFSDSSAKIGTAVGLHAYIINRKTIEKLIPLVQEKNTTIDNITEEYCKNNLCFLSKHKDSKANTKHCTGIIHQDFDIDSDLATDRMKRFIGLNML